MRPMQLRYKFGPKLGTVRLTRPAVAGELPDVEVGASLGDVAPGPGGTVAAAVIFVVPPYSPGVTHNRLVSVHALAVPQGTAEPTDPAAALASGLPQASADASDHTAGGELAVSLDGLPVGSVTILTVLAFEDAPPSTPADAPGPALDPPTTLGI